jgi:hypothetical protein
MANAMPNLLIMLVCRLCMKEDKKRDPHHLLWTQSNFSIRYGNAKKLFHAYRFLLGVFFEKRFQQEKEQGVSPNI